MSHHRRQFPSVRAVSGIPTITAAAPAATAENDGATRANASCDDRTDYIKRRNSYGCNGHGTDVYKSRSTGWDSSEKTKTRYSTERSLTC